MSAASPASVKLKRTAKLTIVILVNHQACSLSHNIDVVSDSFITKY